MPLIFILKTWMHLQGHWRNPKILKELEGFPGVPDLHCKLWSELNGIHDPEKMLIGFIRSGLPNGLILLRSGGTRKASFSK